MALEYDPTEHMTEVRNPSIQEPALVQKTPDPHYIKKYNRYFRKLDRAMLRLFCDLEVMDNIGTTLPVPVIIGTVERAVAAMFGQTSTFNDDFGGQLRRVLLPMAVLVPGDPIPDRTRHTYHEAKFWDTLVTERRPNDVKYGYTRGIPINRSYQLVLWTRYKEHMNQLEEIVLQKFSPSAEIRIPDNVFNSEVEIESFGVNYSDEVDEQDIKVYKAAATLTVKGYLPQPIRRSKTVLDLRIQTGVGNPNKVGGFDKSADILVSVDPRVKDDADISLP